MARSRGPLFPELGFLPRHRRRRRRHAGERPAIITAISVSGIFQPFLVSLFSFPPSSSVSIHLDDDTTLRTESTRDFSKVRRSSRILSETLRVFSSRSFTLMIWMIIVICNCPRIRDECDLAACARTRGKQKSLPRVRHRKMVRGLFERELCRDKNKNAALATPHRKKTCASSHILSLRICMCECVCVCVRCMCVREEISMRIHIDRDI